MKANTLAPELLHQMDAYWRAANYLAVGRILDRRNQRWRSGAGEKAPVGPALDDEPAPKLRKQV